MCRIRIRFKSVLPFAGDALHRPGPHLLRAEHDGLRALVPHRNLLQVLTTITGASSNVTSFRTTPS